MNLIVDFYLLSSSAPTAATEREEMNKCKTNILCLIIIFSFLINFLIIIIICTDR